jgi:hypothetical protein
MTVSIVRLGRVCVLTVLAACGSDPAVGGGPSGDLNAPKGACAIQWDDGAGYSTDFCEDDIWDWHCDSWAGSLGGTHTFGEGMTCSSMGYMQTCADSSYRYRTCPDGGGGGGGGGSGDTCGFNNCTDNPYTGMRYMCVDGSCVCKSHCRAFLGSSVCCGGSLCGGDCVGNPCCP